MEHAMRPAALGSASEVTSTPPPRRRVFLAVVAALALTAALLTACSSSDDDDGGSDKPNVESGAWGGVINPGGDPVKGGILKVDQAAAPEGVSPLYFLSEPSNETMQVVMQIFDQLVMYFPGQLEPEPGLAESWDVSDDGLTYTFRLRDAEFHNGLPVTSQDVKFMIDNARGPESDFVDLYAAVKKVETPDPKTAIMKLSEPSPGLIYYLGSPSASITPEKTVKEMGVEAFNKQPVGSGAFKLKSWKRDQVVELVKNESYWRKGYPHVDAATLMSVPSDNTRILNVKSGTADVADSVPFAQIPAIDKGDAAKVLVAPGADMYVVVMNNSKKPFDEVAVRQALNYATPVDAIIKTAFQGRAPRMNTVIPKVKYWTERAEAYPYDLDKAKQLLAESSVPDGFSTKITFVGDDQASKQTAQIIKASWEKIGVDVTIDQVDDATRGDAYSSGDYELTMARPGEFTTDVPVDDQFATLWFNSPAINNLFSYYDNPVTAKLAKQAISEIDEDRRAELFAQMHIESMKNPPVIPIAYTPNRAAVRNNVHNFNYLLPGFWRLDSVWLD
jgi:peptide/nickel transport system substrate-binding protein